MISPIEKYRKRSRELITYEDLISFPINETVEIYPNSPGTIMTTRLNNNIDGLSFRVFMKEGSYWVPHSHDCDETILVYTGEIKENFSGKKVKDLGAVLIKSNTIHSFEALKDTVFYVEFKNPES